MVFNPRSPFVGGTGEQSPREADHFLQVFNKVWQENEERAVPLEAELAMKGFSPLRPHLYPPHW